jgi:hypothetical protein
MTAGPGYVSDPQLVFPATPTQIPYPTGTQAVGFLPGLPANQAGPVPPALSWAVVENSSPYTLLVSYGAILGWLDAYTSDKFFLPTPNPGVPLTVIANTPNPQSAGTLVINDATVYATWYEQDPGGQYPAAIGAGAITIAPNELLVESIPTTGSSLFGPNNVAPFAAIMVAMSDLGGGAPVYFQVETRFWDPNHVNIITEEVTTILAGGTAVRIIPAYTNLVDFEVTVDGVGASMSFYAQGLLAAGNGWGSFLGRFGLGYGGVLFNAQGVAIGAGATATLGQTAGANGGVTTPAYGGPAVLYLTMSGLPWLLRMDLYDVSGPGYLTTQWSLDSNDFPTPAAGGTTGPQRVAIPLILPWCPVQFRLTNNAAAGGTASAVLVADRSR